MTSAIAISPDPHVQLLTHGTAALADVLTIEASCFPVAWQYPDASDFYAAALLNRGNLNLGLKVGQAIVGYLLATPYDDVVIWLRDADPDVAANIEDCLYVDTIAVLPEWRRAGGATALIRELERETGARGLTSLAIHARTTNGFNALIRRLAGTRLVRSRWLANWPWANGEPYEYLEWQCIR